MSSMTAVRFLLFALVVSSGQLSAQTRQTINVKEYGAKGDCRYVEDAAVSAGSGTLTSTAASFTSADVGKPIYILGAGPIMRGRADPLSTTISAVQSPTTATLTDPAITTASNVHAAWGTNNKPLIQRAVDAAASAGGGTVYLPAGIYRVSKPLKISTSNIRLTGDGNTSVVHMSTLYTSADGPLVNQEDGVPVLVIGGVGVTTSNVEVDHLKLTNSGTEIHNSIDGNGIISVVDLSIANNLKLHDLMIETSSRVGLQSGATTNGYEIYNNYIVGGLHGLYVTGWSSNGYIHDNHLVNSPPLKRQYNSEGIAIKRQTNCRIISNTIEGYGWGITMPDVPSQNVVVEKNVITSASDKWNVLGIIGNFGTNIFIKGNQIECQRSGIGIWFYSNRVNNIEITGNTIKGCPHGIKSDGTGTGTGPSNLTVKDNSIEGCLEAIRLQDSGGVNVLQGNKQHDCTGRYLWVVNTSQPGSITYFADDNSSPSRTDAPTVYFDNSVRRVPKSEIPQRQ